MSRPNSALTSSHRNQLSVLNSHYRLAARAQMRDVNPMKTASVQQAPQKWAQILEWVAAGEEVELTQQEKVVARVIPATQPDFLARAKSIWGEQPAGKPLSALVAEGRR
ncbi:MAG TPA: hypothetical protein VF492_01415 [Verrucomicrobiae bacterium]